MRSTSTRITERTACSGGSKRAASSWVGGSTEARPCSRTIRGGPSNAQNITTIRPFSRACAIVSAPLPTKSRYPTSLGPRTRNQRRSPFGDTFTWPSSASGADEEHVLLLDPHGELLVDRVVHLAHDESVASGHAHPA